MPLSFLYPWFLLGALALAAPVYLHLRRKTEPNLLRFSAVRFLRDQSKARRRPWTLRDVLLLLLRVAAVLLVAAAFAWPYWHGRPAVAIKESVVYVLDNTLSRQANNGFEKDRDRIAGALRSLRPGVRIAVIELTSAPRVVAGFKEDAETARQKVQELKPSFERGSYLAAFRQANSLLATASGQRKRIVLLGDNQANQWADNASSPPFLREVEVEIPKIVSGDLPNLWLSEPRAQRILLSDRAKVNLSVRLGHLGPARSAQVIIQLNGRKVLERDVNLVDQPRNILIQTQSEANPAEWLNIEAQVQGTPDSLEADNHLFLSVPPVTEGTVAVLAQSPYLKLALSPEVMRGQWSRRELNPADLHDERSAVPECDVLCLESSYLQGVEARSLLKNYLASGHGVLLLVNRLTPAIDACLREIGFDPNGFEEAPAAQPSQFQFVFADHSIFEPFKSADFGDLMNIRVSRYARLRPVSARALILSETGAGLFYEGTKYPGKLFVCAFGLERDQTSWPIHPTFIPFLDLALQAARPEDRTETVLQPGQSTVVQLPSGVAAHEVSLSEAGRVVDKVPVDHGRAQVRMPGHPGLYTLKIDDVATVQRVFSVNVPVAESELTFVDPTGQVNAWRDHSVRVAGAHRQQPVPGVGFGAILQQRIWWWMLLGGLLALALEMVFAEVKGERV